jgi:hypothetical protein
MSNPKIIIDNYGSKDAPDAAKFGVGAKTFGLRERRHHRARDNLSKGQSTPGGGPVRRDA